jgi:vacuolar-type H+-ATPase subunit D/Vma8
MRLKTQTTFFAKMSSFLKKKKNVLWHIRIFFEILRNNNGLKKKFKRGIKKKIKTNTILGNK